MIKQNQAQIYLASARRQWLTQGYDCWSTLNFDNHQERTEKACGVLFLFDYQILAPNHTTTIVTQADCLYYLIPLYGGINLKDEQRNEKLILTQQAKQIVSKEETQFEISNPFEQNVSYLLIGFKSKNTELENQLLDFDFGEKNQLFPLFENKLATAFIAHFDVRKEAHYQLKNKENGIFTYIIQGAFEFENRLLETADALSIQGVETVEWEALSENAMLILIETPLS